MEHLLHKLRPALPPYDIHIDVGDKWPDVKLSGGTNFALGLWEYPWELITFVGNSMVTKFAKN